MTNAEFIKKATVNELASFIQPKLNCENCFLWQKCAAELKRKSVGCRQVIREWLYEDVGVRYD